MSIVEGSACLVKMLERWSRGVRALHVSSAWVRAISRQSCVDGLVLVRLAASSDQERPLSRVSLWSSCPRFSIERKTATPVLDDPAPLQQAAAYVLVMRI